jgi:hypothetical protein
MTTAHSKALHRAVHPRHIAGTSPRTTSYPAWSPNSAEQLSTPLCSCLTTASGLVHPAHADTKDTDPLRPHGTEVSPFTSSQPPGAPPVGTPPVSGRTGPHLQAGRVHSTLRTHGPTRHPFDANCGRARAAPKQQAPGVRHGSRCCGCLRHHIERGAGGDRDDPLFPPDRLWQAPHGRRHPKPLKRGHPTRRASGGGEGLPQTTPLLSVRGCKWGSRPLSSITSNTPPTGRERTQVLECPERTLNVFVLLIISFLWQEHQSSNEKSESPMTTDDPI